MGYKSRYIRPERAARDEERSFPPRGEIQPVPRWGKLEGETLTIQLMIALLTIDYNIQLPPITTSTVALKTKLLWLQLLVSASVIFAPEQLQ
jgi:hypothetical protein